MTREDVLNVDWLQDELPLSMESLNMTFRSVFKQMVFGVDTLIDRHNALDAQLTTLSERLLRLEAHLSDDPQQRQPQQPRQPQRRQHHAARRHGAGSR